MKYSRTIIYIFLGFILFAGGQYLIAEEVSKDIEETVEEIESIEEEGAGKTEEIIEEAEKVEEESAEKTEEATEEVKEKTAEEIDIIEEGGAEKIKEATETIEGEEDFDAILKEMDSLEEKTPEEEEDIETLKEMDSLEEKTLEEEEGIETLEELEELAEEQEEAEKIVPEIPTADISKPAKSIIIIAELGGGNLLSIGAGYNIGKIIFGSQQNAYFRSTGIFFGYTSLEDVYILEPALYFDGDIINNIDISGKQKLDIKWRFKIGYDYIKAKEYDIKGSAITFGPDFLFKMSYFYINISFPFVSGEKGTELATSLGTGVEFGF